LISNITEISRFALVDIGAQEEVRSRQILATMKKAQLLFLPVLTSVILFCYYLYSLYSTMEKNTSYNFGKFRVFQHAIVAIHAILIWIERKRGQQNPNAA